LPDLLTSVWEGNDNTLLRAYIPMWFRKNIRPLHILDVTFGKGTFWKGSISGDFAVFTNDLDPDRSTDLHCDYRELASSYGKSQRDTSHPLGYKGFDIIVFDPPHWDDKKTKNASQLGVDRYGSGSPTLDDLSRFFEGSMDLTRNDGGLVICKTSDQIHGGHYNCALFDYIDMARQAGLHLCDIVVKTRKNPGPQNYKKQLHGRRRHSYFICFRNDYHKGAC